MSNFLLNRVFTNKFIIIIYIFYVISFIFIILLFTIFILIFRDYN